MRRVFCHLTKSVRNICIETKKTMDSNLKIRPNPVVMKVDNTPEYKSILTDELYSLIDLFKKYNYELRIAGGAVRDILMNIHPKDIDLATTATPDQMKDMFTTENIRMINMKGEKHGTITPRINDKENFEVTTLRIDVLTDGRHAEVQFTTDWLLDANRRDLTINSMFLGLDGTVYDYFYGYEDLQKRRVVFVGHADARIKEDFLRILRYFRFYGRIAEKYDNHDETTIKAIADNIDGLAKISGERIWGEVKKILQGNFALELTLEMLKCGVSKFIGLGENPNIEELKKVFENSKKFTEPLNPISYMAALLHSTDDAIKLHARLKLSAFERDMAFFLTENRHSAGTNLKTLHAYKCLCIQRDVKKEYVEELLKYSGEIEIYNDIKAWKIPSFPINGIILQANNCPKGKILGCAMTNLKEIWAASDFEATKEDLIDNHLPGILESLLKTKETAMNKKQKTK